MTTAANIKSTEKKNKKVKLYDHLLKIFMMITEMRLLIKLIVVVEGSLHLLKLADENGFAYKIRMRL